jgi:hypothetical protein
MQVCSWSSSPKFDRDCVAFALKAMKLCEASPQLLATAPEGALTSYDQLNDIFAMFDDMNTVKPHLFWLLGDALASTFADEVSSLRKIFTPRGRSCKTSQQRNVLDRQTHASLQVK